VLVNWRPASFSFWISKGHHHKSSIKSFSAGLSEPNWLCLVKVPLRRYFQWSAILSMTLTLTFRSPSIPESQFSKHHGGRPSYWAMGTADCCIPDLMKFR
jgi:hypothetical protein